MNKRTTIKLRSGNRMPIIGLGTWGLSDNTTESIMDAIKMGYPMIDTSGDYGTQPGIGEAIKRSGVDRKSLYIVTKVEETDNAYEATKKNLSELQLDYVDLMLIHRPPAHGAGLELWQGLIKAKEDGLVKDIGVSNYSEDQMQELIDETGEVPVVNQIEWSPFGWSPLMEDYCDRNAIVIQAYSPLTHGEKLDDEALMDMADDYGKTPAQILSRWCLQHGTIPLPKANQKEHQIENLDVFDFEISEEDMEILDNLNKSYSALSDRPIYAEQRA